MEHSEIVAERSPEGREQTSAPTNVQEITMPDGVQRSDYVNKCLPLLRATMKGSWREAQTAINGDHNLLKNPITNTGETALHIAASSGHLDFVQNYVDNVKTGREDLEIMNFKHITALPFAAASGVPEIAKVLLTKNSRLPNICSDGGVKAVQIAIMQGCTAMSDFLYSQTSLDNWTPTERATLLTGCITSGLPDLALKLCQEQRELAREKDENGKTPLEVLACVPSVFVTTSRRTLWMKIVNLVTRCVKEGKKESKGHVLFRNLWNYVLENEDSTKEIIRFGCQLLFTAAECGNFEFLVEILKSCPELILKANKNMETIFHIAVRNRDIDIYNLIYEIDIKYLITSYKEERGYNILHMVAKLPPQNRIKVVPWAALQMQRELLWFRAVENIVPPSYKYMKYDNKDTLYDLFLKEHQNLMKEAENEMRDNARLGMVVVIIVIVVFTIAFTVQRGYRNVTGIPPLMNEKFLMVFFILEAIAMLSASIAIPIFWSLLISSYAEEDFMRSLPLKLLIGTITLFILIVDMIVAFCATFLSRFHNEVAWVVPLLIVFAIVPITFICLIGPFIVKVLQSTFSFKSLFGSRKQLFCNDHNADPNKTA